MINELPAILALFGGYILTSAFFFKYPTLIHKKKTIKFLANHISHRGGAGEYFENTITACKRAQELGTQMLELDCHLTKDGKVIVFHDSNLLRLTGVNQDVSDVSYDQLPSLKNIISVDFEPGFFYSNDDLKSDRRIPLLEDIFEIFKTLPINIDIKIDNDNLISEVARLISVYKREEFCVWGNANCHVSRKCFNTNPKVNLFFSKRKIFFLLLTYYSGLLPFIPIKETHLEIFLPSIYTKFPRMKKYGVISKLFLQVIETIMIRKSLFIHLRKRGIQVYLWVLNDEKEFERAFEVGVTGVMTDFPSKLSEFIEKNRTRIATEL